MLQNIVILINIEQISVRLITFLTDQRYQERRMRVEFSFLIFFTLLAETVSDREGSREKKFSSTRSQNIVPRVYTVTLSRLLSSSPLTLRNPANLFNARDGSSFLGLSNAGKSVFCPPSVLFPFLFPSLFREVEGAGKRSLVKITN